MTPVSILLFIVGYGFALPIGTKFASLANEQNRVALAGHQFGVGTAGLGWLIAGRWALVAVHVVWLIGARLWFAFTKPEPAEPKAPKPGAY